MRNYDFIAVVRGYDHTAGCLILEQRNNFKVGEEVEFLTPSQGQPPIPGELTSMYDAEHKPLSVAPHAQMQVYVPFDRPLPAYTIMRRKI